MARAAPACTAAQQLLRMILHIGADKTSRLLANFNGYHIFISQSNLKNNGLSSIIVYTEILRLGLNNLIT